MPESGITRISTATNATVVQLPERKYPGIVIQGDSLQNLHSLALEACRQVDAGDVGECSNLLNELRQLLEGYLNCYREATKNIS
jgi:hypothetical protein